MTWRGISAVGCRSNHGLIYGLCRSRCVLNCLQDVRLRADIVAGSFLCISVGKLRGYRMVSRICNQDSVRSVRS